MARLCIPGTAPTMVERDGAARRISRFGRPNCRPGGRSGASGGRQNRSNGSAANHSAATAAPLPIQRSRSASARVVSALLRARAFAVERPSLLLRSKVGACAKRRKQAEIHVHRLERRWAGIDGVDMPPVICVSSAPCAVVGGGRATVSPRRSAAAKRPASKPMAADST